MISPREGIPSLRRATRRALELDPHSAEAVHNQANLDQYEWRWEEAEAGYRRAIELNPSFAPAYLFLGHVLALTDRCDEALQVTRVGHRLDPLASRSNLNLGVRLRDCGEPEKAVAALDQYLRRNPTDGLARVVFATVLTQLGEVNRSIEESRRLTEQYPDSPGPKAQLAWAYAMIGDRQGATAWLDAAIKAAVDNYLPPFVVARVYSALGDREQTLHWLERAYEEQDYYLTLLEVSGEYRWLEGDPAFRDLVQRLGLS